VFYLEKKADFHGRMRLPWRKGRSPPPLPQRPFYAGFLSNLILSRLLPMCGLTPIRVQTLGPAAFEREKLVTPRVAAFEGRDVLREDFEVPCSDGEGFNGARLYTPKATAGEASTRPLFVYIHGGGWCINSAFTQPYDSVCARLCREHECCVLSVDYRLAPEHPFPAAVEDVYATLEWLVRMPTVAPGADRQRLVVLGESAGGNLASCVSLMVRDRQPRGICIAHQVILSPVLAGAATASRADPRRADGAFLPSWTLPFFEESYAGELGVEMLAKEPYANPLASPSLSGLPPPTGVIGGSEILLDEGLSFFEALQEAGCDASWRVFDEGFHAFVVFPFGQYADAWAFVDERLRGCPRLQLDSAFREAI
jgi:acetyl esterase